MTASCQRVRVPGHEGIVRLLTTFKVLKAVSFVFLAENGCKPDKKEECIKIKKRLLHRPGSLQKVHHQFWKMSLSIRLNSEITPYPEISPNHAFFCRRVCCMSESINDECKQRPEPVGRVNL